jgi:hypothetical protein
VRVSDVLALMVIFGVPVAGLVTFSALIAATVFAVVFSLRLFAYKDRELEIRKMEVEGRLQHVRLLAGAPPWLDQDDPDTILAWWAARSEVARIEANPRTGRTTAQG